MSHITQQQLESYLWGAATLLRGTIDAGDYKQFIFPLLFFKRLCDVFDEETQIALAESGGDAEFAAYPENHRFPIPPEAHWRVVRKAARNVGQALQTAMRAIEKANPDKLYGILGDARWTMNCFLHGIEDFYIVRGDTLAEPKFVQGDRLMRFDVVLANPPYSIKQWDRDAFAADPWGRNVFGTPPQGRADYAFWQHILTSLAPRGGRCAILFPHGVLFRQEEAEMRRKLIDADLIECVLGLGPNLFYNSPMEACVVVCCTAKPKARKGRILFVNAVNEATRERAQSFLTAEHIGRIIDAYRAFEDQPGFARVATLAEIGAKDGNLSIPLYAGAAVARQERAARRMRCRRRWRRGWRAR